MPSQQPVQPVMTSVRGRRFACSAAAVVGFIVDELERILLLSSHKRPGAWEVVNGGLEANETLLEGALREIREEVGPQVRVRPLGVIHALTFHYDENVPFMISVDFLFAYEGARWNRETTWRAAPIAGGVWTSCARSGHTCWCRRTTNCGSWSERSRSTACGARHRCRRSVTPPAGATNAAPCRLFVASI